jgi:hypothetical protein
LGLKWRAPSRQSAAPSHSVVPVPIPTSHFPETTTPPRRPRTPAADRQSPLEAVTELISERTKYEEWLEDLEAKKDSTPTKVFDRVRQDYLTRLQSVMDQLKQHATALQEHAANLMARLRELEATEQETVDELAEAELRAQVGEITSSEWDGTSKKAQREIAKLKENQDVIVDDLNRIREIVGGGDDDERDTAPRTSADFDELEFLKSVVGTSTPASAGSTRSSATAPPAEKKAAAKSEPSPTPAPPKPAAEKPAESPAAPAPKAAEADATKTPKPPEGAPKRSGSTPLSVPAQGDGPLALRTSGVVEQPKTLKCAECGSMNYPSEWYCERCGAELAAI